MPYAGQIITFTFPHIGNIGVNPDDTETTNLAWNVGRSRVHPARQDNKSIELQVAGLDRWLASRGVIGVAGVDTRALTM